MNPKRNFVVLTFFVKHKCLKRVAVEATGLLNNEPEAQIRGFDICSSKKHKFLKRVAVGATGLSNNEPEAQFCGFDVFRKTKMFKTGRRGSFGTFE